MNYQRFRVEERESGPVVLEYFPERGSWEVCARPEAILLILATERAEQEAIHRGQVAFK